MADNEQGAILENDQEWLPYQGVSSEIETQGDEDFNDRYKQFDNSQHMTKETAMYRT